MAIDDAVQKAIDIFRKEITERDIHVSAVATALLSQVPLIGPYFDSLLKEKRQERLIGRITSLCDLLNDEMKRIDQSKLDFNAAQSEEFQSILLTILRNLEITEEQEKLRYFKNVLINSIHVETARTPDKKIFLDLVRDLSVEHIVAVRQICKKWPVSGRATIGELQGLFSEWHPDKTRRICNDLARYWLLADTPGYGQTVGDQYQVTRHAVDFLKFILDEKESC